MYTHIAYQNVLQGDVFLRVFILDNQFMRTPCKKRSQKDIKMPLVVPVCACIYVCVVTTTQEVLYCREGDSHTYRDLAAAADP